MATGTAGAIVKTGDMLPVHQITDTPLAIPWFMNISPSFNTSQPALQRLSLTTTCPASKRNSLSSLFSGSNTCKLPEYSYIWMAEVQDDDQWLYGDEKDEGKEEENVANDNSSVKDKSSEENGKEEAAVGGKEPEKDKNEDSGKDGNKVSEDNEDKDMEGINDGAEKGDDDDDDDSSDENDVTITIGVLKTQTDIIQAPTASHPARFQPKATPTAGLKDEDFSTPGKVNGVPITEFNFAELEEKPWRKPGADISDYFNYGFNEETWYRYCERQKRMRINESGAGLTGLGISVTKPFGNTPNTIPVTIVNDNSKYGGAGNQRPKAGPPPHNKGMGQIDVIGGASSGNKTSTIQVMTADRREYSNKVMSGPTSNSSQPSYNDMEFGGNPYGDAYYPGENPFYGGGSGFDNNQPWATGQPPPIGPNWDGSGCSVPPPAVTSVSNAPGYFEEDSINAPPPAPEPEEERHRSRRSHRSRSRSPSRHRHSGRHRSRSRSPSHRHKRKKSKRERDAD